MLSSENDPVNIGNPEEMTVKEMAQLIVELTGSKSRIVYRPLPEDDPKVRQPDITRAKAVLGWEPRVPVRAGLVKTVEWFMANHRATTEATT
jgi:nucleoside-diphosphate-sugar epimerase